MNLGDRCSGDRGSSLVLGLTIMFAGTFLSLIWLAGTADRGLSNQSAATSIAFQAARSGAQSAPADALRDGRATAIDPALARQNASSTAARLFESYGVSGSSSISIASDGTVTVTVTIVDGPTTARGTGSARPVEVE